MAKSGRKSTKPPPPAWAIRIAEARERASLSQAELGEKIGKSQQTIADYEGGKPEPNLAAFRAIAKETGADLKWLIFGIEGDRDTLVGIAIESEKQNRLFAWAFHQAARLFAEEGVNADFSYLLRYTQKLLRLPDKDASEGEAKEAVLRAIEIDRAEFRKDIDDALKKRL